jgi:hypothetical protein
MSTQCVILYRNSRNNRVGYVSDEDGESIAVFESEAEAMETAHQVPICQAYPYQIVELSDLPLRT